jgi:hypothetical protein
MSWLYSQALVEAFSEANCSDGEQSVQLNGNPTQQAYCAPDKMTDFSRLSRFGMTFKPLTESLGKELLMLYREDFHAKTSAQPAKELELTESEAECGDKWQGSFTKYDLNSSSWKTHQCSLLGDLDEFSETWPQWGLMRDGECWEQQTLAQTIKGTEYGLLEKWATPTTMDTLPPKSEKALNKEATQARPNRTKPANLRDQVSNMHKWPTPRSCSAMAATITPESAWNENRNPNLETIVGRTTWPTPVTRDYKDSGSQEALIRARDKRHNPGLGLLVGAEGGGQLSPMWVEWLMGWPLGWTDLKPLEMDKSHFVQPQHGEF